MAAHGQPPSEGPPRGLSAAELAAVCCELAALHGAAVLDATPLAVPPGADDLLLVLQPRAAGDGSQDSPAKVFLHVAPGGSRARLCPTTRRFAAEVAARGPVRDLLLRELRGAELMRVQATPGERRCELHFLTATGDRRLVVELFGARGLWALLDAEGRVVVLSRPIDTAVRMLRPGDVYAPPPANEPRPGTSATEAPSRFATPVLAAVDAHYRPLDEALERTAEREALQRAVQRAVARAEAQVTGLRTQLADTGRSARLRQDADLMLAYAHTVPRGAAAMTIVDPDSGEPRTLALDPARPVVVQAKSLYEKARRLDDSRSMHEQRLADAIVARDRLQPLVEALAGLPTEAAELDRRLQLLRDELQRLGLVPRPKQVPKGGARKAVPDAGENFRRFVSAEGYPIWVGRNNEQNDRLTLRIANGNDLWLHVGGGRPGSHVIVRLPKQKTASLETLLDAAVLAVHFSKARGEARIEVVYTQKKHVRKPKGLPAGAVVPSQTRSVTVHLDAERLQRLLASQPTNDRAE
ncbi:MAG: DUF814 domain-containing protein [Planctomycetes bacterium]|nr:DUF814 domain-containing protein [Planctomycetota bacterium]